MRKIVLLASLLFLLTVALAPIAAQDSSSAYVRVVHLAVNVEEVDVYINGNLRSIGRDLAYGSATSWLIVPAGEFEIAVTPAGRSLTAAIIEPTVLTLEPDSRTTIAAIGDTQSTGVTAHLIAEDYSDLGEFQSRITIFHAIPGEGPVDVWLDGELFRGRMAFPGSLTLLEGGTNDGTTTFDVVAGSYNLAVVPNGLEGPVLIDLTGTEVAAQTYYLVVAALDVDGNPTAIVLAQTAN
jgi:hypothetical protein